MNEYLVCVDLGIASVGWALYRLGGEREPLDCGVRIFKDGRNPKHHKPDNAKRRTARCMRKQTAHRRSRRSDLIKAIRAHLNPDYRTDDSLPLEPRRNLLESFESVPDDRLVDVACVLFRFISTRRGPVYSWKHQDKWAATLKKKPGWDRKGAEAEFDRIWQIAKTRMPEKFTEEARDAIHSAIFFQRDICADGKRGPCAFIEGEIRGRKTEPAIQRLAIRSGLANLTVKFHSGAMSPLSDYPDLLDDLAARAWKDGVTFADISEKCREFFGDIFCKLRGDEGQALVGRKGVGPADLERIDAKGELKPMANMSVRAAETITAIMMRDGVREGRAIKTLRDAGVFQPEADIADIPAGRVCLTFDQVVDALGSGDHTDPSLRICYSQFKAVIDDIFSRLPSGADVSLAVETAKQVGRGAKARGDYFSYLRTHRSRNSANGTKNEVARVKDTWGSKCIICGSAVVSFCHAIPGNINGSKKVANGLPLCPACNQKMGSRTPHEFGKIDQDARIAFARHVETLEKELEAETTEKWRKDEIKAALWRFLPSARKTHLAGFRPGSEKELRAIENIVKVGAAPLDKRIRWVRGRETARLRVRVFGLHKDRSDHRHHAGDALMLAFAGCKREEISPTEISAVAKVAEQARISHRPDRFPEGALHNETFCLHKFDGAGRAFMRKKGGRRDEGMFVPVVKLGSGKNARYARPDGNWAFEVFESPGGKFSGRSISRFEANQPGFRAGVTARPHPCAKLVMRLHVDDMLETPDGVWRVNKMSGSAVSCVPVEWGGESKKSPVKCTKSASYLAKNAKILHLSPAGFRARCPTPKNITS